MLLITAAQGNQGRLLVPKIVAAGIPVRACVRTAASAESLRAAGVVDVVVGDICERDILKRAIAGVKTVYHVGPACHPQELVMGINMIDAARAAGVEHFVLSSVLHAITRELVQHEIKRDIEEHLLSSGLEFTILQPTNYMLPLKLRSSFETGVYRMSWSPERKQSLVALSDLTDVCVEVISNGAHHFGATYELASPGRYTGHDLCEVIGRVMGRRIALEQITPDQYLRMVFGDFVDADFAHQLRVHRSIGARLSSHDFVGNPNVLTWLLGREPVTFEGFVRQQFEIFNAGRVRSQTGS
jgi:uncharacterized protein YbjT (DUF2867 family)